MADLKEVISALQQTESGKVALEFASKAGVAIVTDPKKANPGSYDADNKIITLNARGSVVEDAVTLAHCLRYVQHGAPKDLSVQPVSLASERDANAFSARIESILKR